MTSQTLDKKSDLDRLNELIDWYQANKPDAGKIIKVRFDEKKLEKFATKQENGLYAYRGRLLERVPD
jgi:hypothetical protein